ncbi:MAG TPA: glutathione S-transferase family protein [Xanthomonadales bacterium]|nr:glutathione S-transferase family protein [Xanthomonadales bacterium]
MIRLYWCPQTRAARALWLLEELGQPFEVAQIDIRDEASRSDPDFRKASPMGKVPAISDGEVHLSDSAAIALYLADRYPEAGLAPAVDSHLRGQYLYWMVFTPGVIEPSMAERFGGWEPKPAQHGWGSFDAMIETLTSGLETGPWLLGEKFSAADVIVGSSVNFLKMFGILPDSEILGAYVDRCLARPAYQRAMAREV